VAKHEGAGRSRDREKIAARLRALRNELLAEYEQCRAELEPDATRHADDEDITERAFASTADILSHLRWQIRDIDEAFERLNQGRYGLCEDCGEPIPANRLEAAPTARRCMKCQAKRERRTG